MYYCASKKQYIRLRLSDWRSVNALASPRCDTGLIPGVGIRDGHQVRQVDFLRILPHEDNLTVLSLFSSSNVFNGDLCINGFLVGMHIAAVLEEDVPDIL